MANFLKGTEEGFLAKKKNQRKNPSFALSAKNQGTRKLITLN